jgi:rare lipoprotein A
MKKKIYLLAAIAVLAVSISAFSPTRIATMEVPANTLAQDTIKRNSRIADSLKLVSNLSLRLHKKNAHASYYADKFNGRRTASGRRFDNMKFTAAHRKLAFGTMLKVTNELNGKSVIVEVTDRGPFTKGREIDLTKRAFMSIARNKSGGSMKVMIEVIQ